jgi:uncharacterized protein YbgA (DUF1722 family)/uncharacterized protein YbbK (DUF523 family)
MTDPDIIRIGISACLLGEKVRYDGGHKKDSFVTGTLGRYFEWVPVCPEVELGLGTPRESMRLERSDSGVRMVITKTGEDLTRPMEQYARSRLAGLRAAGLCGYILKNNSPSCGLYRVRVYGGSGAAHRSGRGLFAGELLENFPSLPVEEEGRLSDPRLRENWIERVFAYHRLRKLWKSRWTAHDLVRFHAANKLVLLSHAPQAYESLGRLVAHAGRTARQALRDTYERSYMEAISIPATRGRHANVLQHMAGYFKNVADPESRKELAELIGDYRKGLVPLLVPLTLLKHFARIYGTDYLESQAYMNPDPKELALRTYS